MSEQDLFKLKRKVDDAKTSLAELKGTKKTLLSQLKTQFNCSSLKEAEEKYKGWTDEVEELSERITKSIDNIYERYPNISE